VPSLFVIQGRNRGTRFDLSAREGAVSIGRESGNVVQLEDNEVSRRHAEIRQVGDSLVIGDLKSSNGTFVNSRRVERAELHHGDQILIGDQIPIGGQTVIGDQIRRGGEVVHGRGLSGAVPGGACGDHLRVIGAEFPALVRCAIRRVPTRSQPRESARTLGLAGVLDLLRDTG
jgi:hypothetical protein